MPRDAGAGACWVLRVAMWKCWAVVPAALRLMAAYGPALNLTHPHLLLDASKALSKRQARPDTPEQSQHVRPVWKQASLDTGPCSRTSPGALHRRGAQEENLLLLPRHQGACAASCLGCA